MDKIFESPLLLKLQTGSQKLSSNKFLGALQSTMMSLMGVIMVGSLFQVLCTIGSENMLGWFTRGDAIYNTLYIPYNFTMSLMSVWVVFLLGYNYAKKLKMRSPIIHAVNALICFLIVVSHVTSSEAGNALVMSSLGASGMFVGFFVTVLSVRIEKFLIDKDFRIKMPDTVPAALQDGFSSIIPLATTVLFFLAITTAVATSTGGAYTLNTGFMKIISIPLGALATVPGMFILAFVASTLWCFGIHGTMVVNSVMRPLLLQAIVTNSELAAAGEPLIFFPVCLWGALEICGGTGNTFPLILMGLRSKSKQISAVAKSALVPGWFNINEPVIFGMPIMYNPILCIPFILNIPVVMICAYFGYTSGFLQPAWIMVGVSLPIGITGFVTTLRWQSFVFPYLMILPIGLIYYPFFKIYEKQLIEKEQALEAEEKAQAEESQQKALLTAGATA